MAGVVAMASVIEDFDTQPCKKSHKESNSPVVKTITNYFSPVVKSGEKPFSHPRSNNIMDYFNRKALSSKEKTSSPEQSQGNCQILSAEKNTSPEAAVKQQSQKRGRKTSKAVRKLVESEIGSSPEEVSCLIVEASSESKDERAEKISGILGSDTAALLALVTADAYDTAGKSKSDATVIDVDHVEIAEHPKDDAKSGKTVKNKRELKGFPLSPVVHLNDKAVARNSNKEQEAKQPEPDQSSLSDASMEVNVDENSQLNSSTVTISFEDFVRSQDSGENITYQDKNENLTEDSEETSLQVSPRTLTVQAEVHVLSARQEAAKATGKLASIFTRKKGANSPAEAISPSQAEAEPQLPSTALPVKRRSNVVLQEEDLELAVLESESLPKCGEAERKQFMAAFKQPSLDGSKTKPGKSQGKQKNPEEKTFGPVEEDAVVPPSTEEVTSSSQQSKATSKKPAKKSRKKVKEDQETVTLITTAEESAIVIDEKEEPPVTPALSITAVRRSKREVVVRNKPECTPAIPVRKTRTKLRLNESQDVATAAAAAAAPPDSPVKMSTPKTHKSKRSVYMAEMVGPPDTKESPIRIKFTRVHKKVSTLKTESESGLNPSLTDKMLNECKKRRQAKKLVEKAKIIQQSKKTSVEKGALRRSSRKEAVMKRSYCEDEDSIICVEEDQTQTASEKSKPTKGLRSLNDVLGKAVSASKDTRSIPEKTARKMSIFDESSREGSENSQDDEQFKARREFLKSGLPESFRRQIAKTAANKEVYSLSCSSLQPVVHVAQPPTDCSMWSLPWPQSPLLSHLKEVWSRSSGHHPPGSGSFCLMTKPTSRSLCERSSGWRPGITESVRQLLMEEISTSNPPFPVNMFITRFLKRCTDHRCTDSEPTTSGVADAPPAEPVGGKRKRTDDEGPNTVKVAKKQRADDSTPEPQPKKRGGRTRRSQRSRLEENEDMAVGSNNASPLPAKEDSVIIVEDCSGEGTGVTDVVKEDVLWTDKYQPQYSTDIIGNSAGVKRLHSWLREWKLRADREERKKQKDKKQEEGSNDSDWDCGEEDSQDGDDMLCNTMLITGPTGVGKTAAVYACAQELGFKVFEVNASSQRSGRLILSQLKEATQSHQVDSQGVNAHKPTYFNSYSTSSSAGSVRPGTSPRKINSPRRVVSSPRKPPQSPRGAKRGVLAPTMLANFFKMGQATNKQLPNTLKNEQPASKKTVKENESINKSKDLKVKSPAASTPNEEQSKKVATSLILFEEVDVIFDDDSGFLAAIKTFMATTKRPVILTTSDPAFGAMFEGSFEEISFNTPSVLNVATYLQLLCLAEDMRTDLSDVSSLLRLNGCDVRQSLLQLQFWTRSAGGRQTTRALAHAGKHSDLKPEAEGGAANLSVTPTLPPCDTGCTESRLGLFNIEPERDIWELLRSPEEEEVRQELLINSRRRGVDLLYANMETLLPLPLTSLATSAHRLEHVSSENLSFVNTKEPLSSACLQTEMLLSHTREESLDCSDDGSPVKMSSRMKKSKKRRCVAAQDGLHSESDSDDGFLSIPKSCNDSQVNEEVKESLVSGTVRRKPPTPEERVKGLLVSQCLESVAGFLDNMSYMDSSLLLHPEGGDIHKRPMAAAVKDGLTDEWRVETSRESCVRGEHVLQIQSAVESLSFHRCRASVAEAWDRARQLDGALGKEAAAALALPVASHREGYSFTQDHPCQPHLVQERRAVMESLMLKNVAGTPGNRAAAALDYLPALRSICRSERLKERGKVKRRFLHYLDANHLGLDKSTLQQLAEDFP
ncbi:ATPase family AAA domain-containing protein 5 [Betta splendens]|uniref:ATPase family AAA domain-containing protein 5 n=1 Tax=Betta splendens TaxID=158456 RepID=A0A6P7NCF8_BETSP|nr:ATPase family AAA domain-containing protein 5 [Betta splendens]